MSEDNLSRALDQAERDSRLNEHACIVGLKRTPAPRMLSDDRARLWEIFERAKLSAIQKNFDYGSSIWQPPVIRPDLSVTSAIEVRMSDKIARIMALKGNQATVKGETLFDTFMDLGVYCFMWLAAHQQGREESASTGPERSSDQGGDGKDDRGGQAT
jgi:hypothetical protein